MSQLELDAVSARLRLPRESLLLLKALQECGSATAMGAGSPPELLESCSYRSLMDLAKRNYLTSLTFDVLGSGKRFGTAFGIQALQDVEVREHAIQKLQMRSELVRILRELDATGLNVMPLKGPVLADAYYANPQQRDYGDLDLLVSPRDFERARQVLEDLGYRSPFKNEDLDSRYHVIFHHAHRNVLVELHWRIASEHYPIFRSGDFLWDGARAASYHGARLFAPSAEANLVYLAIHAYKHGWARLQWIKDIEQVVTNARGFSAEQAMRIAESVAAEKILAATVQITALLFPTSGAIQKVLAETGSVLRPQHLEAVVKDLFNESISEHGIARQLVARLGLLRTNRERFNVLVPYLKVSDADRAFVKLPAHLSFLYLLIKPLRIALKSRTSAP